MSLLIFVVCIFAVHMIIGYKSGFAKMAFSLVAWIIGFIAATMLTPIVAEAIETKTEIPMMIQSVIYEQITNASGELNIEGIEALPDTVKDVVLGDYETVEELVQNGAAAVVDITGITSKIIGVLALIIVLFGTRLSLYIIEKLLKGVSKLPFIGKANKVLGLVVGFMKALLWNWIVLALISVATFTGYNTTLIQQVSDSQFLTWLYDNNILMQIISVLI